MKQNFKETEKGSRVRLVAVVGMTLEMPARLGSVIFCSDVRQLGCRLKGGELCLTEVRDYPGEGFFRERQWRETGTKEQGVL